MPESIHLLDEGKRALSMLRFAEADSLFQQAAKEQPGSAEPCLWMGRSALMQNRIEEGLHWLDRALTLDPNFAEAMALKGVAAIQVRDYDAAIKYLEQAKKREPSLEMIYFNLAKSYRETGRLEEAEDSAREGLKLNPRNFQTHSELSHCLVLKGKIKDAIDEMLEAIKINPLYLKGYLVLGRIYQQAGKSDLVIRLYREGLMHNPDAIPLREEICNLLALKGDFRGAYNEAHELIKRRGNYSDSVRLGTYAAALKEFNESEICFRKAVELNPEGWEAHYNLGEVLMQLGRPEEAHVEYESALKSGKDQFKTWNAMGLFLLQQEKKPKDAREHFLRALELAPGRPEVLFNLALASAVLKEYEAAENYAKQALDVTRPGHPLRSETERLIRAIHQEKTK